MKKHTPPATVSVALTPDELAAIIRDQESILENHLMTVGNSPAATLAAWRKSSPHYVRASVARGKRARKLGYPPRHRAEIIEEREQADRAADLLEKLLAVRPDDSLTTEDLRQLAVYPASELRANIPRADPLPYDDFRAVLDAWRDHSPRFVRHSKATAKLFGQKFDRAEAESDREVCDSVADLLAKLVKHLTAKQAT